MLHRLDFLNPQWHKGMNVTVRRGGKWQAKANVGDIVELYQTGGSQPVAQGEIREVRYCSYKEVFLRDLLEEHDRECGTPFGLTHAMLKAYPEFTVEDYEMVTVVRFEIT